MFCRRVFIILLLFLVAPQSDASVKQFFWKLAHAHQSNKNFIQVSDLLSPAPSIAPQLHSASVVPSSVENCDTSVLYQCHDDTNKIIACLPAAPDGSRGSTLLLRNDGEGDLNLNVTLYPVKYTYNNVHIPRHEVHKINISSTIRECSSIRVGKECIIPLGVVGPLEKRYKGYLNPVNAAYILFGTVVLIGGMWACYKFRNKTRHLDGIPYEELELEPQKQPLPYTEFADNWDESWDDDWDEEQAVRSPGGNHPQSRLSNGAT